MTSEERDLITGLFNRLRAADTGAKDQEAEQLIGQLTSGQPGAPYRFVQTLLVQEHALNNATVRIQQLEKQVADAQKTPAQPGQSGGFLSGLFGHSAAPAAPQGGSIPPQQLPQQAPQYVQAPPSYPSTVGMAPSAGGGFLRGALQTAAGVAGGSLVAQGIENLMGYHSGPFGGGGGGFFGGGGGGFFGGGGGYAGGGDRIVENNTEVVNNYIDDRGGASGSDPGFQEGPHETNSGDGGAFTDAGFNTSNPFDAPADSLGGGAMDNTFDADNTDASSGSDFTDNSGDDSSTV